MTDLPPLPEPDVTALSDYFLADGSRHAKRLSNVVNASAEEVRQRFNVAVQAVAGDSVAAAIKALIEQLDSSADAGLLAASLSLKKA